MREPAVLGVLHPGFLRYLKEARLSLAAVQRK